VDGTKDYFPSRFLLVISATNLKKVRGRFYGPPLYSVWVFTWLRVLQVLQVSLLS
jgi:hypothetical protein